MAVFHKEKEVGRDFNRVARNEEKIEMFAKFLSLLYDQDILLLLCADLALRAKVL